LYISTTSSSSTNNEEYGGDSEVSVIEIERLKACGGILNSISEGTKLGVVLGTTLVEVSLTTFDGVDGTKLDKVTKSDGLEPRLFPSLKLLVSLLLLLLLASILGTILELCSRTIGMFSIFFFSFLGGI
jgi:hypothetical protein